jgi:cytochrome P450
VSITAPATAPLSPERVLRRLFSPTGRVDPYPWLTQLREHHPVHRTANGVLVFSRYADVAAITRDPAFAVKDSGWLDEHLPAWRDHPGMRLFFSCMVFHNGQSHQRLRVAMSAAFTPARLRTLREVVLASAEHHLDALAGTAEADVHHQFTLPVTQATVCGLVGVSDVEGARLYELVQPILALLDPFTDSRATARADEAALELRPRLDALVAARRQRPRDDLASAVAMLSDDEAAAALTLALAAGFDTTVTLLDNAIRALMAFPDQMAAVASDDAVADAAITETLRYDPPLQLITRVVCHETTVGGVRLEAGQEVIALLAAAHRDPERFPDPDTFVLDRPGTPLLSFGGGPHYCLGARLARLEAVLVLPALLRRFPHLTPAGRPRGNNRATVRGWTSLPVALNPAW